MSRQTFATSTVVLVLVLPAFIGMLAGCGSSNQIQQDQEQPPAADTDTTGQAQASAETDEQNTEALKEKYRDQLRDDYQAEANEITALYILAQRQFYNGNYQNALGIVNKALNVRENADLYALRGSIYLGLKNTEQFVKNWRQALTMDENVPLPLTDFVVQKLQEHGLLNENLERNF